MNKGKSSKASVSNIIKKIKAAHNLNGSIEKTNAMADISHAIRKVLTIESMKILKTAYIIAPYNPKVITEIEKIFEEFGTESEIEKLHAAIPNEGTSQDHYVEEYEADSLTHDGSTAVKYTPPDFSDGSTRIKNDGSTRIRDDLPPMPTASKFEPKKKLAIEIIEKNSLNKDFERYTEDFEDTLTGVIHFLHYLFISRRITEREFLDSAKNLSQSIDESGDRKARSRFKEVIGPYLDD